MGEACITSGTLRTLTRKPSASLVGHCQVSTKTTGSHALALGTVGPLLLHSLCANLGTDGILIASMRFAASTHDQYVFNFYRDGRACNGVSEALQRYREIAPHVRLSGIMHMHLVQPFCFCPLLPLTIWWVLV